MPIYLAVLEASKVIQAGSKLRARAPDMEGGA